MLVKLVTFRLSLWITYAWDNGTKGSKNSERWSSALERQVGYG